MCGAPVVTSCLPGSGTRIESQEWSPNPAARLDPSAARGVTVRAEIGKCSQCWRWGVTVTVSPARFARFARHRGIAVSLKLARRIVETAGKLTHPCLHPSASVACS